MSLPAPTPLYLLTKRLTSFLQSNLSPQIHTTLLTTLSGKLLAHASPHPVSTLRTQCTVAASIWTIYAAQGTNAALAEALPPTPAGTKARQDPTSGAITIQLTGAVLVVRKLRCGLLFVCIGPIPDGGEQAQSAQGQSHSLQVPQAASSSHPTPLGSPSEVESVASAGAATTASVTTIGSVNAAGVALMRRQAEELAKWLDDKLGSLGVPDEEAGNEGR
ncbi:uncharacterized protein PG998_014094 [Apiospora kogelbergensis]|uniref:uncharacterized protein n=1 Tax=Apiospora kogelbergensis TaxID=1337665 RepID=UPI003131D10C